MKKWMQKLMDSYARFMYGRYGTDELSLVLLVAAMVCSVISVFQNMGIVSILSTGLIIWGLFRCFSKNIEKRRKEYFAYMRFKQQAINEFKFWQMRWRDRKTCHYFKCGGCKTVYRVPKGRGKIEVTWPKCKRKEIRHS